MALGAALSPFSTGAAYAGFPCGWPNDPPNDHYHKEYVVNTKHDYRYRLGHKPRHAGVPRGWQGRIGWEEPFSCRLSQSGLLARSPKLAGSCGEGSLKRLLV